MKDTMIIHRDWLIPTVEMTAEEYREYMRAIFSYAFEGKQPEDRALRLSLQLVFRHIDSYESKYNKAVQQRREAVNKRWERYREAHNNGENTDYTTVYDRIRAYTSVYERIRAILLLILILVYP